MVSAEILEGLSYNEKRLLLALGARGGSASPAELIADKQFGLEVEVTFQLRHGHWKLTKLIT